MSKVFESLLAERVENILKNSSDITAERLALELVKYYPEVYQPLPLKHFKASVKNVHKTVTKKLQQIETESVELKAASLKRTSSEIYNSPSKRLKLDEEPFTQNSDASLSKEPNNKSSQKMSLKEFIKKRQEKLQENFKIIHPIDKLSSLVGIDEVLDVVKSWIFNLSYQPLCYRGLLISGSSGCGKTLLAKAIAGENGYPIINTNATDIFQGFSDDKLGNIKRLFAQAESLQPCFVLIEELDEISVKSQTGSDQNRQDALLLKKCIEEIDPNSRVFVIGTAQKLEKVDSKLKRKEVFGEIVNLKIPDVRTRTILLNHFSEELQIYHKWDENCNKDPLCKDIERQDITVKFEVDFDDVAQNTPGYSGKDLFILLKQAVLQSLQKCETDAQSVLEVNVKLDDFDKALKKVEPTVMSEDLISIPETTWKDLGSLENIHKILEWKILKRIKNPEFSKKMGLSMPIGVMLFGPPGCGKTMIAKAMANEASLNFLSVRGPELMDKYVGESERNIRKLFQRAKECSPCLIFFDEIDSICEKRSSHAEGGAKVVQQLLAELDGVANRDGVYVMGATNRIDCVDAAFLRGNRFGTAIYVGLPNAEGRLDILKCLTKLTPLAKDFDLGALARHESCHNFNGADLMELVENATTEAWMEAGNEDSDLQVTWTHFEKVLLSALPSVKESDLKRYEQMADKYDPKQNK